MGKNPAGRRCGNGLFISKGFRRRSKQLRRSSWMNGKKKLSGGATFTPLLRTFIRRVSWILAKSSVLGFVAAVRPDFSIFGRHNSTIDLSLMCSRKNGTVLSPVFFYRKFCMIRLAGIEETEDRIVGIIRAGAYVFGEEFHA